MAECKCIAQTWYLHWISPYHCLRYILASQCNPMAATLNEEKLRMGKSGETCFESCHADDVQGRSRYDDGVLWMTRARQGIIHAQKNITLHAHIWGCSDTNNGVDSKSTV